MNWNVFFETLTWILTVPAAIVAFFALMYVLSNLDAGDVISVRAWVTFVISTILGVIGAATIGGMGWGG